MHRNPLIVRRKSIKRGDKVEMTGKEAIVFSRPHHSNTLMRTRHIILPILACLAACGPSTPSAARARHQQGGLPPERPPLVSGVAGPNDIGLFLAGMPVRRGAVLSGLQQTAEYQVHRSEMCALWDYCSLRLNPMRTWSDSELAPVVVGGGTVLYPFGGPDLLYVNTLFPKARTYALMGLEKPGDVPALEAMPQGEVLAALKTFRQATRYHLANGFFVTEDMRSDLQRSALRGVTPILLSTVALAGGRVESIGSIAAGGKPGVELRFRDAAGKSHRAIYVEGDLSNSGFNGAYRQWLTGLGGNITYFKAASYLMHDSQFSQARDFFLAQSRVILQDDSGIPFRYFSQDWTLRFFGNYNQPINLFSKFRQDDLRQAYRTHPTSTLPFGAGYRISQLEGNLLLAIKH